jgi:hypothetical protein
VLVVDASIGRAAGGEDTTSQRSEACRTFLSDVLDICHKTAFGPDLLAEWRRHRSRFARTWLISMFARSKVVVISGAEDSQLVRRIAETASDESVRKAIEKDGHLVVCALASGGVVASLDERMRRYLTTACESVQEIRRLEWVNPANEDEGTTEWLEAGAAEDRRRRLSSG